MLVAIAIGILLSLAERYLAAKYVKWLPSGPAIGLAFVIPASISVSMFVGAMLGWLLTKLALNWSQRFLIAAASGLVAGESITGVGSAIFQLGGS